MLKPKEQQPMHPDVTVELTSVDGNAFSIIGACRQTAKQQGLSQEDITRFVDEATSGDYDHLLATCMHWFTIE
jgi:hypothetical protein